MKISVDVGAALSCVYDVIMKRMQFLYDSDELLSLGVDGKSGSSLRSDGTQRSTGRG